MFLAGARLNNLTSDNIMELKILKINYSSGSSFGKINWKPLSLKMSTTLRIMPCLQCFLQKCSENKGMQVPENC